ncbi:MAG TPA: DUF952 domain-containing protein [Nocardioidaceae bacterium]|nr:DUF952 domain-containing protein [Nocardioidaceae bacterium]
MRIFHLALPEDWAAAQERGAYDVSTRGVTLEQEGFIHCSLPEQVEPVRARYYADVDRLLLLAIDTELLTSPWRMDVVPGAGEFPHVYGPVNLTAVVSVEPVV